MLLTATLAGAETAPREAAVQDVIPFVYDGARVSVRIVHAIALAGLLVGGNYAMARQVRARGQAADLEAAVLAVVDFAARTFPTRV